MRKIASEDMLASIPLEVEDWELDCLVRHSAESWRGPHQYKEGYLLEHGFKRVVLSEKHRFQKHILPIIQRYPGRFNYLETDYDYIAGTSMYAIMKVKTLIDNMLSNYAPADALYHAKLGILLGYTKEHIRSFIDYYEKRKAA